MNKSPIHIPFSRPNFSDEEEKEVIDCLRSGWITTGPRVENFEKQFTKFIGCKEAVAVSCGTAGLHLALMSLDLQPGDEVITPSLTWVSVPNLIVLLGAKPVFCDIDIETMNATPQSIEKLITSKTRAIIPVHFAGRPVDLSRIQKIARDNNIVIIEDACHAVGAFYKSDPIGSHSPLCVFSFHPNKNITTAEGGMVTGSDVKRLKVIRQMRFHGVVRSTYDRFNKGTLPHYETLSPGLKYNMTDLSASLGIHQMKKLKRFNSLRKQLAEQYRVLLKKTCDCLHLPPECKGSTTTHAWHLFPVRVDDKPGLRDSIMAGLLQDGIQTGLHYLPVHEMPYFRKNGFYHQLPNTEKVGRTIFSLPMYPGMKHEDQQYVTDHLKDRIAL